MREVAGANSHRHRAFLDLAARVAADSEVRQRHGAVAVRGGRVLAVAANRWRNPTMRERADARADAITVHAELAALSRLENPEGVTLYVARLGRKGETRLSRPCNRCYSECLAAGVRVIYFTVDP